jgi:UDP-N-acetylmuramoyl-L-alanyl-D-glutamate--2,6-diaminopimelate ligase
MRLIELIQGVNYVRLEGTLEMDVGSPTFDFRTLEPGGLYVAITGAHLDGHYFVDQAIAKGAKAIVCDRFPARRCSGVTYIQVSGSRGAVGQIAANFYGHPSECMRVVGVTGTNGKTSTVILLSRIFRSLGHSVGFLSTIQNQINDVILPSTHTTPDSIQINRLMKQMVDVGCEYCFMEVTSHAIVQDRVKGLVFSGGVFTNLTHDHLSYHKTFDAYFNAKKTFFDGLSDAAFALTNIDDVLGRVILQKTLAKRVTYGLNSAADFNCNVIENAITGLSVKMAGFAMRLKLRGRFNAYNMLAAYSTAVLLGADKNQLLEILPTIEPVSGRFEVVPTAAAITAIVDFAHTPDGLNSILRDLNEMKKPNTRVMAVVGCGGDKDKQKRRLMGKIGYENSDLLILTSDNPGLEDPFAVVSDMMEDLPPRTNERVVIVLDREAAIQRACEIARPGDTILVAGKGHEKFQIIGYQRMPFNDTEVLQRQLSGIGAGLNPT